MSGPARRFVVPQRGIWLYVAIVGAVLVLEGAVFFALGQLAIASPSDTGPSVVHILSGLVLLAIASAYRAYALWAALIVGAFYTALGVVGVTIDQPFGLHLGVGENVFHFVVGLLLLAFGAFGLRTVNSQQAVLTNPQTYARPPTSRRRPTQRRKRPRRR